MATVEDGPNKGRRFIVREEQGVLNRSIYWINVLDPEPRATTGAAEFAAAMARRDAPRLAMMLTRPRGCAPCCPPP